MSELLRFEVISVDGGTARIRADTVHPDQYDIPAEKNFALQIVVEGYWMIREGYMPGRHVGSPELERLLVLMHGREIEISEAQYERLTGNIEAMRAEKLTSVSFRNGRYWKNRGPAYREFIDEAERQVSSVHLTDERNHPRRDAADPDASAVVVFTLVNPWLLAHLRRGAAWDSALYDFRGWES